MTVTKIISVKYQFNRPLTEQMLIQNSSPFKGLMYIKSSICCLNSVVKNGDLCQAIDENYKIRLMDLMNIFPQTFC